MYNSWKLFKLLYTLLSSNKAYIAVQRFLFERRIVHFLSHSSTFYMKRTDTFTRVTMTHTGEELMSSDIDAREYYIAGCI